MAVVLHFTDNTSATLGSGQGVIPYPDDNEFIQVTAGGGTPLAIAPAAQIKYAEIQAS